MAGSWLIARAWAEFVYMDLIALGGFRATHWVVRRTRTNGARGDANTLPTVLHGVSVASLFHLRSAYCLKRSAVLTRLLRRRGIEAELVVGYRHEPLQAHAWVEVAGTVVGDIRPDLEYFSELDRW